MSVSCDDWGNKAGTTDRECSCGSWKKHWINMTKRTWPGTCSVRGCNSSPILGAHVYHADVTGERIVPMCDSCNKETNKFSLKGDTAIPSAKKDVCS